MPRSVPQILSSKPASSPSQRDIPLELELVNRPQIPINILKVPIHRVGTLVARLAHHLAPCLLDDLCRGLDVVDEPEDDDTPVARARGEVGGRKALDDRDAARDVDVGVEVDHDGLVVFGRGVVEDFGILPGPVEDGGVEPVGCFGGGGVSFGEWRGEGGRTAGHVVRGDSDPDGRAGLGGFPVGHFGRWWCCFLGCWVEAKGERGLV